ncbi:50S ribosomal protein L6 [Euryarchaeota archaeon ex4484_162]|nr:MAG: 50S ribosomal protein L6 [Euryarchaeota archaeon ex4484_162]
MAKIPEIVKKIPIPENVQVNITEKGIVEVKSEKAMLSRELKHHRIKIEVKGNNVEVKCELPKKKEKALVGTFAAHIRNMIKGVTEGFEYKMKTVYSHFPIKTRVDGNEFIIENFLGERFPRKAKVLEGVQVEIKGEMIYVRGTDKEKVGQTVANIERATRIKDRDIRVFQDGIYLISKGE